MHALKVLHCPTLTAGHSGILASAERRLGLNSKSVATKQNYLSYVVDEVLCSSSSIPRQQFALWQLLLSAAASYDVVHYNAGTTILPHRFSRKYANFGTPRWLLYTTYCALAKTFETLLLRSKIRAVTFQGDDARQGDVCLSNCDVSVAHYDTEDYYTLEKDNAARARVNYFNKHADLIYAQNPDLLRVLPSRARFVPYCCPLLGQPALAPPTRPQTPLVVHAPTNRMVKGTGFIVDAVGRLRTEGFQFDFRLIEGMAHSEALALYAQADLVVDQLLVGWYGTFAMEAMAMGKPVVCYIRDEDLRFIPNPMAEQLPIIKSSPSTIYSVLKACLSVDRDDLSRRGQEGREFVAKWHDPISIAKVIIDDYHSIASKKSGKLGPQYPNS
jgi:hypothetical protein